MSSSDRVELASIERILDRETFGRDDLVALLSAGRAETDDLIRRRAGEVRLGRVGPHVYLRGLVEISNVCEKNCRYCGIRRDIRVPRYSMSKREILACVRAAREAEYGSVVLQSGERSDPRFVSFIEAVVAAIRRTMGDGFGITLSCGEQSRDTYTRWRQAGADRYLLRIETSNEHLYRRLHPADHSFSGRVQCLEELRDLGYQLGSGVIIGLPGQTVEDLADDLLFLRRIEVDMIGMGPYLVHRETGLGTGSPGDGHGRRLQLALRMISVARLLLPDVNIAATTALEVLHPRGRELGLEAGANVVMPLVTPPELHRHYALYESRPTPTGLAGLGRFAGMVALGTRGDPPHFRSRRHHPS